MNNQSNPKWLTQGYEHIWMPYSQMQTAPMPLPVVATDGCYIHLDNGEKLVDGMASWWTAAHGYNNPHLLEAAKKQLEIMPHIMFGGLAHEPAYKLAQRLCDIAPSNEKEKLSRVFFSDSGSVATEVAMKMALQYWKNIGIPHKDRFICIENGYHGDTFGAMSVSDPHNSIHKAFKPVIPKHYVIERPSGEFDFAELDETLEAITRQTAALIIEPLVQGAGGMKFYPADTLAEIYRLCKKHNILFIADEIATGFYRTGTMFACDEAGIVPDIMCLGKALTGGMMTLAATMAKDEIFESFLGAKKEKALMHGPTYMANPLACAIANASLDLFEQDNYFDKVTNIETHLYRELSQLGELSGVVDVRVRGAIGVVQLAHDYFDADMLCAKIVEQGCWLRPYADMLYMTPPLTISQDELTKLTDAVITVTTDWSKETRKKVSNLFDC